MTTMTALITALASTLTVTGVTRKYTNPPASLNTADLPASFPYGFRRTNGPMTFGANGGWPTTEIDFIIAIEPVGQNTQPANYTAIQTLADALETALTAISPTAIGKGPLAWAINAGNQQIDIAGTMYWSVSATITARG